jgi:hypothetical protein
MLIADKEKNGLRLLARQEKLTHEDWYSLLESRRQLLADYAREMPLGSIGELNQINGFHVDVTLNGIWSDPQFKCRCEGVGGHERLREKAFLPVRPMRSRCVDQLITRWWALTRNGHWLLIEVEYLDGRVILRVSKSTPEDMLVKCAVTPSQMFYRLAEYVKEWRKRREILLEAANSVAYIVSAEHQMLELAPRD